MTISARIRDRIPPRVQAIVGPHGGFAVGLLLVVALVAWLTLTDAGRVDIVPVVYLLVLGIGYRVLASIPQLTATQRERAIFVFLSAGLFGFLGTLSAWDGSYLVFVTITIMIYAIFALGLNLQVGFTGIINFGHVAFMGLGAYTTALLSRRWLPSVREWAGEPTGLGLALVLGFALLAFIIAAIIASVAAEAYMARQRPDATPERRRRVPVYAGLVGGLIGVAIVVLTVEYPLSLMWATTYVIGTTVLLGMLVAAAFGLLLGIPTLRLREDYLAIVTIGFAEILRRVWTNEVWLTDGPRGVIGFPIPLTQAPTEWAWVTELTQEIGATAPYKVILLLMCILVLVLVYVLYEVLVRSPYGRVLKAIREDEDVASALGKNVFVYKLQALAIGSAVAAVAGSLLAWHRVFISPNTFLPLITFYAWMVMVIGGIGNNKGMILGAFVLWTFFEATRFFRLEDALNLTGPAAGAFRVALIGLLLVVVMMFKPEGLLGNREEMVLGK